MPKCFPKLLERYNPASRVRPSSNPYPFQYLTLLDLLIVVNIVAWKWSHVTLIAFSWLVRQLNFTYWFVSRFSSSEKCLFLMYFAYSFIGSFSYWFVWIFYVSCLGPTFRFLARRFCFWLQFFSYMLITHKSKCSAWDFLLSATPTSLTVYSASLLGCPVGFWGSTCPKLSSSSSHPGRILQFCFLSQEYHHQRLRCPSPELKCGFWCKPPSYAMFSPSVRILIHKYPLNPFLSLEPECYFFIPWSQETLTLSEPS